MRSRNCTLTWFIAWFWFIPASYGIDPSRALSQYVHDTWGPEQGFPPGPVYAIAQGGDGYLWIGAEAGLIRFDGWTFHIVNDDSHSFATGSVLGLTSDEEGCLWIRTQDLSVLRYCRGVFDRPTPDADLYTNIEAMNRTNHGELLTWKAEAGAFVFRHVFQKLASSVGLPRSPVISVAQTGNGDVYMGTRDAGLFRNSHAKTSSIRTGLPDLKVNCLLSDGAQSLWVGTDDGIARWNGSEVTEVGLPPTARHFQALAMVQDRDGNLWVGTDSRGLLRLNSSGFAFLRSSEAQPSEAVTALFEDREGNLWIGHAGGLERLRDSAFVTYSSPEGLPADGGVPVFVDSNARLWFPPVSGGLWWAEGGHHGRVVTDGLNRDVVYALDGTDGELWIGRQRGGLTHLYYKGDSFHARTYTSSQGLAQNSVYSVYRARDGTVWAGTLSAGVSMLRNGRFTNFTVESGLSSNTVVSILETSNGTMWFATPTGLSSFEGNRWRSYTIRDGLPSENINCLLEDSTGTLWVGTASGIAFRKGESFQSPGGLPEPLREQIFGLAEDQSGFLWIAASNHVLRVNREKLLHGVLTEGDLREFGLADGLRGAEGVKRNRSVVADQAGRIWFSLNRGISAVDPQRLTRYSAPAILHIQMISADGRPISMTGAVHIPGGAQRITFGFVGLSLSIPERTRYRYLLEGYDHAWSEPTASREAGYTNLGPGAYRLRVVASTPDAGSAAKETLAFRVDPLFWQTWWFRLAVFIGFAGIALALYRFRLRQATKAMSLRFQERLAERTRIAQELHDTLLQGFLSASMQVDVAAGSLPEDSPAKPILNRSLELMRQVIDEGRKAVRGLRSSKTASLDLEHAFSQIQQELGSQDKAKNHVAFQVVVEGQPRPLHPLLRDELYRIGREAVINAFRHAHASKIEMELKYSPNRVCILVRDDGSGIAPEVLQSGRDGHFGLSGMRERADRIGARLSVMSRVSAGTEIELSVPASIAFQREPNGKVSWMGKHMPRWPGARKGDPK